MHEMNWMYLYLQSWVPIHGMEELCEWGCCIQKQRGYWDSWNLLWRDSDTLYVIRERPELEVQRRY